MASIDRHLPSPGSAVWRRDVSTRVRKAEHSQEVNKVRHVVIRDAEIWERPTPHVMYRIDVLTEHDHWYLFRRYSQFHSLHRKLVKVYNINREMLPPKKLSGNLSKQLIDKRRQLLERYLQNLVHGERLVAQSQELLEFLDVPTHDVVKVTDLLTKHLYRYGDQLLEKATPIALSVNEMYSITKRLQLPRDATGVDPDDVSSDPAHLYSFMHQLVQLRIAPPPAPSSVCCSKFDMAPFRSLHILKLDRVPLSQIDGLVTVQQQLEKLIIHRGLHTLKEILIEAIEEKRGVVGGGGDSPSPRSPVEKWRLSANVRLTGSRIVIQPWHKLHTLTLSHNLLTHIDDSLQVLPVLRELNLSHNQLQVLQLQFLCLPSLEKLNVSHNSIHTIDDNRKVLERITYLNLSHNRLTSLERIHAFIGVCALNVSYNVLAVQSDLDRLTKLKNLNTLSLTGNPLSSTPACRLILLTKFLQKSRLISLDGQELTNKEQLRIQTLTDKHGPDPDLWPIAKSLLTSPPPSHSHPTLLAASHPPPLTQGHNYKTHSSSPLDGSPRLELSWQFHSPAGTKRNPHYSGQSGFEEPNTPVSTGQPSPIIGGDYKPLGQPPLTPSFSTTSTSSETSPSSQITRGKPARSGRRLRGFPTFQTEEQYSVGSWHQDRGSLASLRSREDPDGQSDISSNSPERLLVPTERRSVSSIPPSAPLTPPPSTPLTTNGNSYKPTITPDMIQSALEALEQMENKDTPISLTPHRPTDENHGPIFPEAVTSALTAWISSQSSSGGPTGAGVSSNATPLLSPPPSTPLEPDNIQTTTEDEQQAATIRHGISASDLITALSTLMPSSSRHDSINTSEDSSKVCSVPACTPKEGISEWIKLGIRPDEVIQALSVLTIASNEEEDEPSTTERVESLDVANNDGSLLVNAQTPPLPEQVNEPMKQVLHDSSKLDEPVYHDSSGYHDNSEDEESDSVFSTPPPPPDFHQVCAPDNERQDNSTGTGMSHREFGIELLDELIANSSSLTVSMASSDPNTCDSLPPVAPGNDNEDGREEEERTRSPEESVLYSDVN